MSAESNKLATLGRRLVDGYARIEAARATGYDVAKWEAFWLDLLRLYEAMAAECFSAAPAASDDGQEG